MPGLRDELRNIRPTWAEIDLRAFERNVEALASRITGGAKIVPLLKADAYGHGAVELARRCNPDLIAMIGVALLEEALELRQAGITMPILILGPLGEEQVRAAVDNGITLGIPGPEELAVVAKVARERDVTIHLKLDTGMGRMGCVETELPEVVDLIRSAPRIRLEAIYTHFANASDPRDPFTGEQIARFHTLVETLREAGVSAPLTHMANSAAAMRGIVEGDFVRIGVALLGAAPLDVDSPRLEPLMRWRTEIARIKEVPAGHVVGYGKTFVTKRPSRIATIPVGYADGYPRRLSNQADVLVRGRRVPVAGRISMDLVTIDITDLDEAALGDEVVLLGRQGSEEISAEELASKLDTISYEVFCNVGARVPRVYIDGDDVVTIRSRFT